MSTQHNASVPSLPGNLPDDTSFQPPVVNGDSTKHVDASLVDNKDRVASDSLSSPQLESSVYSSAEHAPEVSGTSSDLQIPTHPQDSLNQDQPSEPTGPSLAEPVKDIEVASSTDAVLSGEHVEHAEDPAPTGIASRVSSPPSTLLESTKLEQTPGSSESNNLQGSAEPPADLHLQVDLDTNMEDIPQDIAPSSTKTREREDDDPQEAPSAKRAKTDELDADQPPETNDDTQMTDDVPADGQSEPSAEVTQSTTRATDGSQQTYADAGSATSAQAPLSQSENYGQMTELQHKRLQEGMRNLKKGKHAPAFLKPVDPQALNLPTYPDIIKNPMDLGTMEAKLKANEYNSVNEYIADLNLIVDNAITFNGAQHPVAQSGTMLRAHAAAQLKRVPKADEPVEANTQKQRTNTAPPPPTREAKRRGSRNSLPSAQTPAADRTTFAPGPDGVPAMRRQSTLGDRPARKIRKPPPKDLSYPKPVKKKFQLELQFCKFVLEEMTRGRFSSFSQPFLQPVDPVALGVPEYFKIVKKPMDVKTISQKYDSGQYENAKEFEADFRQIFANCYKFNPAGNAVHEMGKNFEQLFNETWKKKQDWMNEHQPTPVTRSPEEESEEEEEEEEEDEEDDQDEKDARIAALHKQLTALQKQTAELMEGKKEKKDGKKKGGDSKPVKAGGKGKKGGASAPPAKAPKKETKAKPKPKATKPLTNKEKKEVADRVAELSVDQIAQAAEIIKRSFRKIGRHDLANKAEEEMEFDIELIPDDALRELLQLVRKHLQPIKSIEKDMFDSPEPAAAVTKSRKHKPMTKAEQEEKLRRLQGQLDTFKQGGSGAVAAQQDAAVPYESSGDEDESESEEE